MQASTPTLRTGLFRAGQRIAVAVSGGSDSVALLRCLLQESHRLGILLSVVHVHHGIRGAAADEDAAFVSQLAHTHNLPFHVHRTDAPLAAETLGETLEEAARNLRYAFFREWLAAGQADAIATAHTLDDQAETVLHKFIRGAWTEGLSGIFPVLPVGGGTVLRPFLENRHGALQDWLRSLPQTWREDLSNQDMAHTRNRIRSQLLPLLNTFNPQIAAQLSRLAAIAADEELYWQGQLQRLLPSLVLPGKPARGGGRSSSTHPEEETVAMERTRLRELPPAVARRVVRAAARQLGARLSFDQTEQVLAAFENPSLPGRSAKFDMGGQIRVERSAREVRLSRNSSSAGLEVGGPITKSYTFMIPGEVVSPELGLVLRAQQPGQPKAEGIPAVLRVWQPGDRVKVRHSRNPKKVAEVLDRLRILGDARKMWPVVEAKGTIVWMRGVDVETDWVEFVTQGVPEAGTEVTLV